VDGLISRHNHLRLNCTCRQTLKFHRRAHCDANGKKSATAAAWGLRNGTEKPV
jgi:hypothetical protein